ncbi:hypothetical protein FRC01_009153 [Tulasnella sp. 417]|nr:hypothetical protein FRC01_009153 [Tulasnella sp. 417]
MMSFPAMKALKQAAEQCATEFLETFQRADSARGIESKSEFDAVDAFINRFDTFKASFDYLVRQTEAITIRQRNALLPILKLPEELLRLIFHLALLNSSGRRRRNYLRRISTLRAVSWVWRDLIDRTPLFWTQISSSDHPDFVSNAFDKSLKLPLHLNYTGLTDFEYEAAFFDKASPHQTRWKSVAIHEPSAELLHTYFNNPNPSITGLLLSTDTGYALGEAGLDKLLGGEVEKLEELRAIRWRNIVWSDARFTQLRVLEIEDYQTLGMGVIFDILAGNPSLEVFRLDSIRFAEYTPPDPAPPEINLERLTELKLANIEQVVETDTEGKDVAITHILQRIRAPACRKFEVESCLEDGSGIKPEELVDLMLPPMQVIARGRLEVSDSRPIVMNVCFGEGMLKIKGFGDLRSRPSFAVKLGDLPGSIARRWITEQLEGESSRTLDLRLRFKFAGGELPLDEITPFQCWESVTSLDINGAPHHPYTSSREFLRHLSAPFVSDEGAKRMPFPRLEILRLFDFPFKGKDLVDSVTMRFDSNALAPEGLTVILADGAGGRPGSYIDTIRAIPGVKDVRLSDDPTLDGTASLVSDWPPHEPLGETGDTESCEG